ncbi:MAG: GNAT family N-acetyltransferase [Bacillota bacterium]|nr:GNAT family N-acetyltransferase [Bacillota bacterium]
MIWQKDGFIISTEKRFLDEQVIHQFLSNESYWAKGISREEVSKAIHHSSICFGMFEGNPEEGNAKQVGFARFVTDFVRFAYLMDVFIIPEYRGIGLSKWLMKTITEDSELKNVNQLLLATADAHGLYSQFGFKAIDEPDKYMRRRI